MHINLIKTEDDYESTLARIESLLDAAPDTNEMDELELLTLMVSDYESKHHPIDPPDPIEAILFRMEQRGMDRAALIPIIGSRHRVSEVLNRKRGLSLNMIRNLHNELGIPLEVLIKTSKEEGNNTHYAKSPGPEV